MTLKMLNIDLLDKTMNYITEHPEQHDQGVWRCGTSRCFAGWACTLDGAEDEIKEDTLPYWATTWRGDDGNGGRSREAFFRCYSSSGAVPESVAQMADEPVPNRSDSIILSDREKTDIATYARRALGLDSRSADILFGGDNSLRALQGMVQHLKEEGSLIDSEWDDEREDDEYEDDDECSECGNCLCCCTCEDDE